MKRLAICLSVMSCHRRLGRDWACKGGGGSKAAAPAADDSAGGEGGAKAGSGRGRRRRRRAREREPGHDGDEQAAKVEEEITGPKAQRPTTTLSWQDIVVVPRKAFLKGGRLELAPFAGITVNDNLIRHYVFGVDLNYFLTDALWVGAPGAVLREAADRRRPSWSACSTTALSDDEQVPLRRRAQLRLRARLREVRLVQQVASCTGRSGRRPASA